ncbi:hypothetical protein BCR34DRAFT_624502 [Clohesyomyces aquaticus]|uniref:Uncharacterized protein n=1 Tax=Clohesyomyces aquaticus TaxID=1231657 RepID=A0A1Y1ZP09_9PLEO|nr:hypothetical protein BCR34DRAFT_624502 [Clohesyomyces aquaticus]
MPAERTTGSVAKQPIRPVKTERTHEENQERRSDRSLEARVESARRASEIHKKRTGRALRVTEQDVQNEEMYEEEDDDIPTQYQRLSAHLQTSSMMFNRRLQNYLATQMAVRNPGGGMYQPYPGSPMGYGQNFMPMNFSPTINPQMLPTGHQMLPPQAYNPQGFNATQHMMNSSAQSASSTTHTANHSPRITTPSQPTFGELPQGIRHAPYGIPVRPQAHQRSASIPTPQQMPSFQQAAQHVGGDDFRRMSLPPRAEASPRQSSESKARPSLSRSTTANSVQHSSGPSSHGTPTSNAGTPPSTYAQMPNNYATSSQVLNVSPFSMSLPPESQQFLGHALDPNDPYTSMFMSGSEHVPQPNFSAGTYSYNPNLPLKSQNTAAGATSGTSTAGGALFNSGMNQTLGQGDNFHINTSIDNGDNAYQSGNFTRTSSNQGSQAGFDDNWLNDDMFQMGSQ